MYVVMSEAEEKWPKQARAYGADAWLEMSLVWAWSCVPGGRGSGRWVDAASGPGDGPLNPSSLVMNSVYIYMWIVCVCMAPSEWSKNDNKSSSKPNTIFLKGLNWKKIRVTRDIQQSSYCHLFLALCPTCRCLFYHYMRADMATHVFYNGNTKFYPFTLFCIQPYILETNKHSP
jgi:hypothetical protein